MTSVRHLDTTPVWKRIRFVIGRLLVLAFGLLLLYPLIWMMNSSLKSVDRIFSDMSLTLKNLTFDNYIEGWKGFSGTGFDTFFSNSFVITGLATLGNIISCVMAGYAFAKLKFPLRNFWFAIMMGTLMLPLHVKLIPQYILYNNFNMLDTIIPLTLPKFLATDGFFIFLANQFMRKLPKELDEASRVDGCGYVQHFLRIIIPLSVPAIITTGIFSFLWTWNDFFSQMIYLNQVDNYTVSIALRLFTDSQGASSWGSLFAMSTLSLVPLFLMFVIFQNYLVEGLMAGSIKG